MSPMACSCFVASRSDDVRLRVDPSNTVFFRFNPLDLCGWRSGDDRARRAPRGEADAGRLDHLAGGSGSFAFPTPLQIFRPPLLIGPAAEATQSWDVTSSMPNASRVNDLGPEGNQTRRCLYIETRERARPPRPVGWLCRTEDS